MSLTPTPLPDPCARTCGEAEVEGLDLVAHGLHGIVHGQGRSQLCARHVEVAARGKGTGHREDGRRASGEFEREEGDTEDDPSRDMTGTAAH